ncbi:MAG: OmpA family protein [Candidatus Rokubacteria bacterium]|nr:OmpA family protein [Candidatus Rokubacteria bacterium]
MRRKAGETALGLLVLSFALWAGCARATRDDLYVLLPSQDGTHAAVAVTHGAQQQVLEQPFDAARIRVEGQLEKGRATEQEIREVFGAALAAQPARPVSFTLYFLHGKDDLTPESEQVVGQIFSEIARRPSPEVVVIGHADAVGSHEYNDRLSLQRAGRMRDDLVKWGIPVERIRVEGRGKRERRVPTAEGVPEPLNRRVEISVR